MNHESMIEANRRAWNEAMPYHRRGARVDYSECFKAKGFSVLDPIETPRLLALGLAGRRVAQLCCNNGIELLSLMNLGARSGVGFDISDEAIADAKRYAEAAGSDCAFVRTDVYAIGSNWAKQFDLVYITIGAIAWLPDLARFFRIAASLLAPGGTLMLYDTHPAALMFGMPGDPGFDAGHPLNVMHSYFRAEPWVDENGIDYIGKTTYQALPAYNFTHTLSSILNGMLEAGLRIERFEEFDHDISTLFGHVNVRGLVPLSMFVTASTSVNII